MIRKDSRRYQRPHLPALTARSVFFMFFDIVDMTVCMSFANMWGKNYMHDDMASTVSLDCYKVHDGRALGRAAKQSAHLERRRPHTPGFTYIVFAPREGLGYYMSLVGP